MYTPCSNSAAQCRIGGASHTSRRRRVWSVRAAIGAHGSMEFSANQLQFAGTSQRAGSHRQPQAVPARQQRRRLRTHVRKEHPAEFFDRIGRRRDLVFEIRAFGFVGLLEAASAPVEFPAVIRAADPVFGRDPVRERRAAMGTGLGDESKFPTTVFEEHEVFAEQAHALGPAVIHLFRRCDRVPVAALEVAHRRPASDLG